MKKISPTSSEIRKSEVTVQPVTDPTLIAKTKARIHRKMVWRVFWSNFRYMFRRRWNNARKEFQRLQKIEFRSKYGRKGEEGSSNDVIHRMCQPCGKEKKYTNEVNGVVVCSDCLSKSFGRTKNVAGVRHAGRPKFVKPNRASIAKKFMERSNVENQ